VAVRELRNQEAQHDSGAIVRNHGREQVQFEHDGKVLTLEVERGVRNVVFYMPARLRWDNGDEMPAEVADLVRPVIDEVERFWRSSATFKESAAPAEG
jgi:hypothetical protein